MSLHARAVRYSRRLPILDRTLPIKVRPRTMSHLASPEEMDSKTVKPDAYKNGVKTSIAAAIARPYGFRLRGGCGTTCPVAGGGASGCNGALSGKAETAVSDASGVCSRDDGVRRLPRIFARRRMIGLCKCGLPFLNEVNGFRSRIALSTNRAPRPAPRVGRVLETRGRASAQQTRRAQACKGTKSRCRSARSSLRPG